MLELAVDSLSLRGVLVKGLQIGRLAPCERLLAFLQSAHPFPAAGIEAPQLQLCNRRTTLQMTPFQNRIFFILNLNRKLKSYSQNKYSLINFYISLLNIDN